MKACRNGWLLVCLLALGSGRAQAQRLAFAEPQQEAVVLKVWQPGRVSAWEVASGVSGPWGWSPQGDRLAYLARDRRVAVVSAQGGEPYLVPIEPVLRFDWSPQGTLCGLQARTGRVVGGYWEWKPGEEKVQIRLERCAHWVWSRSGERVAAFTVPAEQEKALRMDALRGEWRWRERDSDQWHAWEVPQAMAAFSWAPDGKRALCVQGELDFQAARRASVLVRRRGSLRLLEVGEAGGRLLAPERRTDGEFQWSSDGRWIAFFDVTQEPFHYALMDIQGGETVRTLGELGPHVRRSLHWTPRGVLWAVVEGRFWKLMAQPPNGASAMPVAGGRVLWFEPDPVGRQIAVLKEDAARRRLVTLVRPDGEAQEWISASDDLQLAWSPDGTHLAVGARDGSLWIGAPPASAGDRRLPGAIGELTWSPDGRWLLARVRSSKPADSLGAASDALWAVPAEAGEPVLVSPVALGAQWEPRK